TGGLRDAREGEDGAPSEGGDRVTRPGGQVPQALDLEPGGDEGPVAGTSADLGPDRTEIADLVGSGQYDQIGAAKGRGRLPQHTRREGPGDPRRARVRADQSDAHAKAPLLEAIVEDEDIRAEAAAGEATGGQPIPSDHDGNAAKAPGQKHRLVPGPIRADQDPLPIGHDG